jgi:molybdopterin-guanine dinucleotide biosynthesis protein A
MTEPEFRAGSSPNARDDNVSDSRVAVFPMSDDIAIVILAGGEGKRMGGGKPLKTFGGERLIDRALRFTRQHSGTVAIAVRNREQVGHIEAMLLFDEPNVSGPLAGLIAGLKFAREQGCDLLLTIAADMPFLPSDLPERLRRAIGNCCCALPSSGAHVHPVCGLWRTSALEEGDDYVAAGRRSLKGFAEFIGATIVEWPSEPLDPFFNTNKAEDLASAERRGEC